MRSDTPRYSTRSWVPRTNFERPAIERWRPLDDLLDGIPEAVRDVPLPDGDTPRQKAEHINTSGCRVCWFALQDLKAVHA